MYITKFGHSCLLIEEKGARILLDPGSYSTTQNKVRNLNSVLITHEHQDHLDMRSLKTILHHNPHARIVATVGAGKQLEAEEIAFEPIAQGGSFVTHGVLIEAYGHEHALLHASIPVVPNCGFFIANRFFYPGDAFVKPSKQVEILALPVAAPWMRLAEAIDYGLAAKPLMCIPVHDRMLKNPQSAHRLPKQILEAAGVQWVDPPIGKRTEC